MTCPLDFNALDVSRRLKKADFDMALCTRLELCKESKLNGLLFKVFKRGFALTAYFKKKRSNRAVEGTPGHVPRFVCVWS
jgi:hypothetical protein